jgi:hypothetical protein
MSIQQKLPLSRTLPLLVQRKAAEEIIKRGQSLPCHVVAVDGAIVTVAFDVAPPVVLPQAQMPVAMCEYIQFPVQVNDVGVAVHMTAYIGAASGLGTGAATLTLQANLSTLVFLPLGNLNWPAIAGGGGAVVLNAPQVVHTGNASVQNGVTGSFTTPTGQTVDVQDGIITNIY